MREKNRERVGAESVNEVREGEEIQKGEGVIDTEGRRGLERD